MTIDMHVAGLPRWDFPKNRGALFFFFSFLPNFFFWRAEPDVLVHFGMGTAEPEFLQNIARGGAVQSCFRSCSDEDRSYIVRADERVLGRCDRTREMSLRRDTTGWQQGILAVSYICVFAYLRVCFWTGFRKEWSTSNLGCVFSRCQLCTDP